MVVAARYLMVLIVTVLFLLPMPIEAQDGGTLPDVEFTALPQNPVLTRGEAADWDPDCGTIFAPQVIEQDGNYYIFYTGCPRREGTPGAIGYAHSSDGINWTKGESNPIIFPDGTGYDSMCVSVGVPLVDDAGWSLYYASNSQPCAGPGKHIGRATAERPEGEWVRDAGTVLEAGRPGEWDAGFIMPHAVLHSDDGYVMFYSAGEEYLIPLPRLVGMATSADGVHWTKYNDPATTDAPYADSDPIMRLTADGVSEPLAVWALDVLAADDGWEMFFSATCPDDIQQDCPGFIAYARSDDGIHWTTYPEPELRVLTPAGVSQDWAAHCVCYPSALRQGSEYWLYFTGCVDSMNDCQIGMARGTVSWHD